MTVKHGTRYRYSKGCRCDACAEASRIYQRDYRLRSGGPQVMADFNGLHESPGPVEAGVQAEIGGLGTDARPGLAQAALAMARILDTPTAVNQQPAAAKVLTALLDKLGSTSARGRRGGLALVKSMTPRTPTATRL
jgi:hypothetical protein